jgi:hypothetical protein
MYPFKWRNIFVPYLPESMRDYLEVPVPCLMGMDWDGLFDGVRVDIDAGKVVIPESIRIPEPPVPHTTVLSKHLRDIVSKNVPESTKILELKSAFYNFFLQTYTDTSEFMVAFRKT